MKAKKFYYEKGDVKTDVPWFRVDPVQINAWRDDVFKEVDLKHYDLWALGSAINGIRTWDFDVNLVGEVGDHKDLKEILDSIVALGFKNRQLVDVSWIGVDPQKFQWQQDFNNPEFLNLNYPCRIIRSFDYTVKNGRITRAFNGHTHGTEIGEGLWEYTIFECAPKIAKKYEERLHPVPPVRVTPSVDFREYIPWP